ncbi:MAG: hypothetical protein AAB215_04845 [Planctomycetota bacterium]
MNFILPRTRAAVLFVGVAAFFSARSAFAGEVSLRVDEPAGVPRQNFHVRGGVPFPKGLVKDASDLVVKGGAGPIPASIQEWVKWPDGSVMWALVDFGANLDAGKPTMFALEWGGGGRSPSPSSPLSVEESGGRVNVNTGPLQFSVGPDGLEAASLGGQKVVEGMQLVTVDGGPLEGKGSTVVVEEKSPVHCVIRCEGTHAGKFPYTLRFHALAGSPTVKMEHTWISDQDGEKANVTSIEVRVKMASGAASECAVGPGLLRKNQWGAYGIDPAAPEASGKAATQVTQGTWNSFTTTGISQKGRHHRGWIGMSGGSGGLAIGVRDFHRLYRKGLKADPGSATLTAYIWAGPNAIPLKRHSPILNIHKPKSRGKPDPGAEESIGNSRGLARTHDVMLHFYKGGAKEAGVDNVMAAFDRPSIVYTNPKWVADSRTFGAIQPYTPGQFDSAENWIDRVICWWYWNQHNDPTGQGGRGPWYSFIDYGDWQITYMGPDGDEEWQYLNGRYSWDDNEPDICHALWVNYARTGDRLYYDAAEAFARHAMDIDCAQVKGEPDYWGAGRRHCVSHWGEDAANYGVSHTWTRGWLDYYKFAGYRRSLDVARAGADFGWHVVMKGKKLVDESGRPTQQRKTELWDREFNLPTLNQVCLWETTGEAVYKQRADDLIKNAYLKFQHPDGCWTAKFTWGERKVVDSSRSTFKSSPGGFSVYYLNPALIIYHELTGDAGVSKGLVRNADFLFKRQDHMPYALQTWAFAYEQTQNSKYTQSGQACLSQSYKGGSRLARGNYNQGGLFKSIVVVLEGSSQLRAYGRYLDTAPYMMKALSKGGK